MTMRRSRVALTGLAAALCLAAPAGADHPKATSDMHHQEHGAAIDIPAGPTAPTLAIAVKKDPVGGWNVQLKTTNFRFAPAHASLPHIPGEGHAHLYVNGKKIARVYSGWFHIGELPTGKIEISATLNANDHRSFSVNGHTVRATAIVHNVPHTH